MRNQISIRLSCNADNVAVARMAVATFAAGAGFTIPDVEEIKVAVSEAVSNAVLHAYPGGQGCGPVEDAVVEVLAFMDGDELHIEVTDRGRGIADLAKAKEPGFTTVDDHVGLGLLFVDSFMDEARLESEPGRGTRVRMVKRKCP